MSLLLLDIGNSRTKWAIAQHGSIQAHGAKNNSAIEPLDGLPTEIAEALRPATVTQVWISCVANNEILDVAQRLWLAAVPTKNVHLVEVSASLGPITNNYRDLRQLGIDRWVACFGARQINAQGDVIIVDAGTAVTVDWLSSDNVFMGGAILPGASLMHRALVGQTAGIDAEQLSHAPIVGQTTTECVNSGVIYGLVGAVENVVNEMQKELSKPAQVVLCGGASELLLKQGFSPMGSVRHEPHLVPLGLLAMAQLNDGVR